VDHIEGGETIGAFLEGLPAVSRSQVIQFLELAKDQLIDCASSWMGVFTRLSGRCRRWAGAAFQMQS